MSQRIRGNSLILDVRDYTDTRVMGSTRDDAAGECFDKIARVLGMPYPGGRALDERSRSGNPQTYVLPRTRVGGYDMSFSGLKTATLNIIHNAEQRGEELNVPDLCAGFVEAVKDMLVPRTMEALAETGYGKLAVARRSGSQHPYPRSLSECMRKSPGGAVPAASEPLRR